MTAQVAVRALGAARIFLLIRKGMTAPPGAHRRTSSSAHRI